MAWQEKTKRRTRNDAKGNYKSKIEENNEESRLLAQERKQTHFH